MFNINKRALAGILVIAGFAVGGVLGDSGMFSSHVSNDINYQSAAVMDSVKGIQTETATDKSKKRDVEVNCSSGTSVTVSSVPVGVTLNNDYWCKYGGGTWRSDIDSQDNVVGVNNNTVKNNNIVQVPVQTLRPGMINQNVTMLQKSLESAGYFSGIVNGNYDNITTISVINFQKKYQLTADGIAGPNTINKLNSLQNNSDKNNKVTEDRVFGKPIIVSVVGLVGWYNGSCVKGTISSSGVWSVYSYASGCTASSPVFQ